MLRTAFLLAALLGTSAVPAGPPASYVKQIEHYRAERLQNLTAPYGWLSLIGLPWLHPGENTVGSARDNSIVIAAAPAHLATVDWRQDGTVTLALNKGAKAGIVGSTGRQATMLDDSHAYPTIVRFGTTEFYLVTRGERKGLRVKDSQSPRRTHFLGLDYFPIDPALRITAKWIAFEKPHQLKMGNMIGGVDTAPVPGKAVFTYKGHSYSLEPVGEADSSSYFLVFADQTSGKETYGAARFLDIEPPKPGTHTVVIDFNKAVNPPCAFTPFATCPIAPPQNRLGFRVTAGEKKYAGAED